jgi:predicted MPP superfamily phosphohydrolase
MPDGTTAFLAAIAGLVGLSLLELPGWRRWLRTLPPRQRWSALGGILGAHLPLVYSLLLYKAFPLELPTVVWTVAWIPTLGVVLAGVLLTLWAGLSARRPTVQTAGVNQHRREFLRVGAVAVIGMAASTRMLALPQREHVQTVTLALPNLPDAFDGLSIGMVADVHSGPFMQRQQMEHYRRELEALGCDLIVLPGDFIINRTAEIYPFAEAFAGLSAPLGVFAVTGNHDYFSGQVEQICRAIEDAGVRVLRNEAIVLERGGEQLSIAGIDDFYARALPEYLQRGRDPDGVLSAWERLLTSVPAPRIVLCHCPYYFEELVLLGADGVLAGHTHGGQIVLARVGELSLSFAALVSPYVAGTYYSQQRPSAWMYVTRGIGTVGIPVRWNCPPEITHIRLVKAKGEHG